MIKEMAVRMKGKFDKYWGDYSVILALAAILNPRLKIETFRFCYNKLDPNTCQEKLDYIKSKLYHFYSQYERMGQSSKQLGGSSHSRMPSTSRQLDIIRGKDKRTIFQGFGLDVSICFLFNYFIKSLLSYYFLDCRNILNMLMTVLLLERFWNLIST